MAYRLEAGGVVHLEADREPGPAPGLQGRALVIERRAVLRRAGRRAVLERPGVVRAVLASPEARALGAAALTGAEGADPRIGGALAGLGLVVPVLDDGLAPDPVAGPGLPPLCEWYLATVAARGPGTGWPAGEMLAPEPVPGAIGAGRHRAGRSAIGDGIVARSSLVALVSDLLGPVPGSVSQRRPTAGARRAVRWLLLATRVRGLAPGVYALPEARPGALRRIAVGAGVVDEVDRAVAVPEPLPAALLGVLDVAWLGARYASGALAIGLSEIGTTAGIACERASRYGLAARPIGLPPPRAAGEALGLDPATEPLIGMIGLGSPVPDGASGG